MCYTIRVICYPFCYEPYYSMVGERSFVSRSGSSIARLDSYCGHRNSSGGGNTVGIAFDDSEADIGGPYFTGKYFEFRFIYFCD